MNRANWILDRVRCGDCGAYAAPRTIAREVRDDRSPSFKDEVFVVYMPARCPSCRSLRAVEKEKEKA